ncbi:aldehyde dehydrogenase family protein, partial [Gulosibacter chungangensis]
MTEEFFGHIIGNKEVPSANGETFGVLNPYTNEDYATAALGGEQDAAAAIAAARQAFDEGPWPRMGHAARTKIIYRLTELLRENLEEFAQAESRDMGMSSPGFGRGSLSWFSMRPGPLAGGGRGPRPELSNQSRNAGGAG